MELKLIHILGPVFATVAMFFYGKIMVDRSHGRQVNVFPTLILIAGALIFAFFTASGTLLDRICTVLLDIGVAMIIDSSYLARHKEHPKVFWVPGLLAVLLSLGIWGTAWAFGWKISTVSNLFVKPTQSHAADLHTGEILLELGPDDDISELEGMMEEFGARYARAFPDVTMAEDGDLSQFYLVHLPADKIKDFLAAAQLDTEDIDNASANLAVGLEPMPKAFDVPANAPDGFVANDPGIAQQWWMDMTSANQVHNLLKDMQPKRKAVVAIIDTGVDGTHEDLKSVFGKSPAKTDPHGHGTHCAGLAGAATNNGRGMASYNWDGKFIEIRGYAALGKDGQGTDYSVAEAMIKAVDGGADVLSMSLGSNRPAPKVTREAVEYALRKGCIVVAAAGNDYGNDARNHSPVGIDGVIGVAAVGPDGRRTEFSNVNTNLTMPIAAPGLDIYSTMPGGSYAPMSGTSMATPIVSGLIGVLRSMNPDLDAPSAWTILNATGVSGPSVGETGKTIDPVAAISMVR